MNDQPLSGLTVIDFSTLLPGPLATLMLAEAGATVIKIERPGGEDMRFFPPKSGDVGTLYAMLNRGKRCLELDLKAADARARILELTDAADIVVEQFRPGVMARLGLGADELCARNPRLIHCSITGFGQSGPRAMEAGHDLNYMALTGLLALSRGSFDAPVLPPAQFADIGGGSFPAVINILLALLQRDRTGKGSRLDIAMCDAMFTFALFAQAQLTTLGHAPKNGADLLTGASPRYRLYPAADGHLIAVGALEDKFWQALCDAVELPDLHRDDRRDSEACAAAMAERIASRTAAEWVPVLAGADCCATPLATLEDAFRDPHFLERGLFDFTADADDTPIPATIVPIDRAFRGRAGAIDPD
ncbi:CaiB/BaiF CoA-transferase family protein [Stappia sp. ES.058]|uniref:CaiB/BaiF CoA transferase family protein n=1 Tax=Stappia sp. ES.058 TaxID=1881061 RepID=UPI00087AE394|nr:CoA transferase [Stappia sp. ES.058]SDU09724.1 Crotonobetainyl-CoA:carnitine CoA-transferase CaiB [Stappia sp. ES.058]